MSRTQATLATIVAVLAVSAVACTSAYAGWWVEGTELSGTSALATTAEVTENPSLKFSETTIECKGSEIDSVSPQIEAPNKASAASLTFKECSAASGSNCTLTGQPVNIGTEPLVAEVTEEGEEADQALISPKTKTIFATLKFEGSTCSLAGLNAVTGKATVRAPIGQEENSWQEIVTNTASGQLKVGTAAATLKGIGKAEKIALAIWAFAKKLFPNRCVKEAGFSFMYYETEAECLTSKKPPPGGFWRRK